MVRDKNKIHAWFWVRSALPKHLWKKCMEYKKMDKNGKSVIWHVNKNTNVPQKVRWLIQWRKIKKRKGGPNKHQRF